MSIPTSLDQLPDLSAFDDSMNFLLLQSTLDQAFQIAVIIIALVLALLILRFVLRVAARLIMFGCVVLVLLGLVFGALYYLGLI